MIYRRNILSVALISTLALSFVLQSQTGAFFQTKPVTSRVSSFSDSSVRSRIDVLRFNIEMARKELNLLNDQIPLLQQEIESLIQQMKRLEIPARRDTATKKDETKHQQVKYRLPLAQIIHREKTLMFVCQKKKLYIFDTVMLKRALVNNDRNSIKIKNAIDRSQKDGINSIEIILEAPEPHGNFNFNYIVFKNGNHQLQGLVLRKDAVGTDLSQIMLNNSEFSQLLQSIDPQKTRIQFVVYPESSDVFRKARTVAWNRKISVWWMPFETGESVPIGGGGGPGVGLNP